MQLMAPLVLRTPMHSVEVWMSRDVPVVDALSSLGYPESDVQLVVATMHVSDNGYNTVDVPFAPLLPGNPDERSHAESCGVSLVCTPQRQCILRKRSPVLFLQLAALVAEGAPADVEPGMVANLTGCPLDAPIPLPPVAVILPSLQEGDLYLVAAWAQVGSGLKVQVSDTLVRVSVNPEQAFAFWMGFPLALLSAQGWGVEFRPAMPLDDSPLTASIYPLHQKVRITVQGVQALLIQCLFASRLQAVAECLHLGPMVEVEVKVVAHTIWRGSLPQDFSLQLLPLWWSQLAPPFQVEPRARLYSGPYFLGDTPSCAAVLQLPPKSAYLKKCGAIMLNLHPMISGGGVKEENRQLAMTKLATLCLNLGVPLQTASAFTESVVTAAGVPKLTSMLSETHEAQQWEAVQKFAVSRDIAVPATTSKTVKAQARAQRAAQRLKSQPCVRAADVQPEPGFFLNADDTPTTILQSPTPGASGLLVVDVEHASELLVTLQGIQPDELALLVLGHEVPLAHPGSQKVSFPAHVGDPPSKVLVAGTLCNVGGKPVKVHHKAQASVDMGESYACQFSTYRDEFAEDSWGQLTQAPVRYVAQAYKDTGLTTAFSGPWSRTFSARGRPATPLLAEVASFYARVDREDLDQVLRSSGHNLVYLVPKDWNRQPLAGYGILWFPTKAEAARVSLQLSEQRGLVRSKDRFGVRIPEAQFTAHMQVHPGKDLPVRLRVSCLFRAGPFPLQASAADIQSWSIKVGWQAKALKMLGAAHWLLGAEKPPPSDCLAFNGQTVLLTAVRAKEQSQPVIQSGVLPSLAPQRLSEGGDGTEDPWATMDPWKAYKKAQPAAALPHRPQQVTTTAAPRQVAGPTEIRFQEQESRITAMEQGLKELKAQADERHQELQTARQEDIRQHHAAVADLKGQIGSMSADFATQLKTSVDSLQGAQSQQMMQVMSSFEELKAMISCRDRDPAKKPRTDPGA